MSAADEACYDTKALMSTILHNFRFALRHLRREPGFALVAILTLAVGIGATTTVFSIFNSTVLNGMSGPRSDRIARIVWVLMGAVCLLLLLACASVSSLLLARTANRQRELALRATLGALQPQIFRQLLVESQALAFASAVLGMLFATWALPTIQALGFESLPQLADASIDFPVVAFTVAAAVVTGFLCGLAPAYQASTEKMDQTLRGGERIVTGSSQTIRDALVISQLALAVVLLVGAALLINSFLRLLDGSANHDAVVFSGLRLNVILVGLFAAVALGLAALGVYAVTAFAVARRRREIGVRMALGAAPSRIVGVTLGSGTKLIVFGTAIGLFGAFVLSRFLRSLLYEIGPGDPLTYGIVILILIVVATTANYLPARRATKVDPRVAFVSE
jgi:ABC-type antimicrobial peptide transport system permease subunit